MSDAIVVAIVAALGSVISAYFAHKAEKNSRPVSNGFAEGVISRLDNLHEDVRELRKSHIKHIAQDH